MKLFVLFGQRKCDYPGQYAMEALACMDENGNSDNPDYLEGELAKYKQSREFDRLSIVTLAVSEDSIKRVLYPEQKPIEASVVTEH
ncbi:TPA: hypothetical protein L4R50_000355 [Pseudomonas aeruginosa]|nr:hypothetical protein [Pseudomonas aeruginosa]